VHIRYIIRERRVADVQVDVSAGVDRATPGGGGVAVETASFDVPRAVSDYGRPAVRGRVVVELGVGDLHNSTVVCDSNTVPDVVAHNGVAHRERVRGRAGVVDGAGERHVLDYAVFDHDIALGGGDSALAVANREAPDGRVGSAPAVVVEVDHIACAAGCLYERVLRSVD
jgi:hypothetical protein